MIYEIVDSITVNAEKRTRWKNPLPVSEPFLLGIAPIIILFYAPCLSHFPPSLLDAEPPSSTEGFFFSPSIQSRQLTLKDGFLADEPLLVTGREIHV